MNKRNPVFHPIHMVLFVVLLIVSATACGHVDAALPAEPATAVVHSYFQALQDGDIAKANQYLEGGEMNVFAMAYDTDTEMGDYITHLVTHLEYVIAEIPANDGLTPTPAPKRIETGTTETISVQVTTMDVPALFDGAMEQLLEEYKSSLLDADPIPEENLEPQLYDILTDEMDQKDAPLLSGTLSIPVVWDGNRWNICPDSTLYNAVTGNFLQIIEVEKE